MAAFKASLRPVDGSVEQLMFDLNPATLHRTRHPMYGDVNAALADWTGNYPTSAPAPIEWLRNPPEEISADCMFHKDKGTVDDALEKLDKFMAKGRNGQPPDLIFSWGKRYDRVRITSKDVEEKIHNEDGSVRQAQVRLTMKTIRARTSKG